MPRNRTHLLAPLALLAALVASQSPAPATRPAATAPAGPAASSAPAASAGSTAAPRELRTVYVGDLGILTTAALYVAIEKGYFREQGIDVDLVTIDGSARAIPLLATGAMDSMVASATAGMYNAINQGIPIGIVADKATQRRDSGTVGLVVRQDLLDSGVVRILNDLRGRRIGVNTGGSANEYQLYHILKSVGVTFNEFELIELTLPDIMQALGTGRLDGAMLIEPFQTIAHRRGVASMFVRTVEVMPEYQSGVIVYSDQFRGRDQAVTRDWMVAYLRGIRAYQDARREGIDRESIIDIMMKYTTVKDRGIYDEMTWAAFDPNGRILPESLMVEQDYYRQIGLVQQAVPMERAIDEQFIHYAVERLRPYQE